MTEADLRVTLRLCPSTSPPLPQLLLHAPLWSRFFEDIIGGLGLSKVADPIKEFGKWASEPFTYFKGSDDSTLFRWFVYYSLRVSVVTSQSHMTPLCCILSMTLCMTQLSRCSHYVDDDDTRSVRRYQLCTNNSVWTRNTYTRNAAACHVSRVTKPASCNGGDGGSVECHGGMQAGKNEYLWNYDCWWL